MENNEINSVFINDEEIYNKKVVPIQPEDKNADTAISNVLYDNIVGTAIGSSNAIDINAINSLSQSANSRNEIYNIYDTMCEDGQINAVIKTYAQDSTEKNEDGNIVWATSSAPEIAYLINYYIDRLNINKNIYKWAYSLCKYGDVYIRLYRESEYEDALFTQPKKKQLNEDVKIKAFKKEDNYAHYIEIVTNPAEMFELTKFGKTVGYIQTPVEGVLVKSTQDLDFLTYAYKFKKEDILIYPPTEFVHACIDNDVSRYEETVNIFLNNTDYDNNTNAYSYSVKKGQSLLANVYKIWRELQLLEASVLLNRVTKSSIVRIINVEVGDMAKEDIPITLNRIKQLIEQKTAINKNTGMTEYTNPGPIENNIYVPSHNQVGTISTQQIGGDVDVKSLADLDWYLNKLFSGLQVPKQYFCLRGDTPILLLDGQTKTIKYLYEHCNDYIGKSILSCSTEGEVSATTIKNIMLTKHNANFIRIHLDNNAYVDVTPEHRLLLKNGCFVEAKNLKENDFLMSCYKNEINKANARFVTSIEPLNVIENAYDIEVESENHTFALPCGIFVHNCQTDDSAGFNGGQSLTIISSRYAKTVKYIQSVLMQLVTDILNLILLDKGLDSYINNFEVHLLPPVTQEDVDRVESQSTKVQLTSDIMNMLSDVEDPIARLKILKNLLSKIVNDDEIISEIQAQIEQAEEEINKQETEEAAEITSDLDTDEDVINISELETDTEEPEQEEDVILPTPEQLGVDMLNAETEEQ